MKLISFDIETTGLDWTHDEIFSYCLGDTNGNVGVYRLDGKDRGANQRRLEDFFADTSIIKIAHNYKFEYSFMRESGISIPEETHWEDTMLMSQLLRNTAPSHSLDYLAWELCGYPRELDFRVKRLGTQLGGYQNIPKHIMTPYQRADGERTMLLFLTWRDEFVDKLERDYRNELELVKVTYDLEKNGMKVHRENALKLLHWLEDETDKIRKDVYKLYGEFINLNSDTQVARILHVVHGLPVVKLTKKGGVSTNKNVLLELREKHDLPILDLVLKQRSYTTGMANISSYLKFSEADGYIHPTINTNQARTGRESSSKPNLQNVSKEEVLKNPYPVPARKCFCAPDGFFLCLGDYAGQEIRLIVDLSGDEEMLRILEADGDLHSEAGGEWYGSEFWDRFAIGEHKVWRSAGKNCTFAKCYGAGLAKIALTLGLHVEEAKLGLQRFCERFPRAADFSIMMANQVREHGYVQTPFGRKLYIPHEKAYIGGNYIIQGTAAGMIKRAQVNVSKFLKEEYRNSVQLLLPVHDEIILRMRRELYKHKNDILTQVSERMTNIEELIVPMKVEWKTSMTTWDKAKELKLCV